MIEHAAVAISGHRCDQKTISAVRIIIPEPRIARFGKSPLCPEIRPYVIG
jgi:hypothetical protein